MDTDGRQRENDAFWLFEEILEEEDSRRRESLGEGILGERIPAASGERDLRRSGRWPEAAASGSASEPSVSRYEIEYEGGPFPGVGRYVRREAVPAEREVLSREPAGEPAGGEVLSGREPAGEPAGAEAFSKREAAGGGVLSGQEAAGAEAFSGREPDGGEVLSRPDPVRELFERMREIGRQERSRSWGESRFYDGNVRRENARVFYRQGIFMKDFEDEYPETAPYSAYYPFYQLMGYRQLRTYFTWRTQVRRGTVRPTSLSYAFLYLYELLSNIGVDSPEEGLERILFFWREYRAHDAALDSYVPRWLKDYYIYYELPGSFREFAAENGLEGSYPELEEAQGSFALLCALSGYDIRKSKFYTPERRDLIEDCVCFVEGRLGELLAGKGILLEDLLFAPGRSAALWVPFQGALFYPWAPQRDRRVILSSREAYFCNRGQWIVSRNLAAGSGKKLAEYLLRQTEASLRRLTGYPRRLSADQKNLSPLLRARLEVEGIRLEDEITRAAEAFYREATRTVVTVDAGRLERIRREALLTQERLTVPEEEPWPVPAGAAEAGQGRPWEGSAASTGLVGESPWEAPREDHRKNPWEASRESALPGLAAAPDQDQIPAADPGLPSAAASAKDMPPAVSPGAAPEDPWRELWQVLTPRERGALEILSRGGEGLRAFADREGVMLEVLLEGINGKAMDVLGDALADEGPALYEDYAEQVKEMVRENGQTGSD